MSDYMRYLNMNAITLGDAAYNLGDYKLAVSMYNKALSRLMHYQGDRMLPIMMAGDLKEKIKNCTLRKTPKDYSHLYYKNWKLSKTTFIKGLQCSKYLYLNKNKPREKTPPDEKTKKAFDKGHQFEDYFRKTVFPNGINLKDKLAFNLGYFDSYTKHLLSSAPEIVLFEGTVIEEDVLIMGDVIHKIDDKTYNFYEIKQYTELKEVTLNDLAIQYYVYKKRFGKKINKFNVVLRKNEKDWQITDVKHELEKRLPGIENKLSELKTVLKLKDEPKVSSGNHCYEPYKCEFVKYCNKGIKKS